MTNRDIIDLLMQPSLAEFKQHLRITSDDQDALLMQYLKAAAVSAEHHIGRCLEESVFTISSQFAHSIRLERVNTEYFPLRQVLSVKIDGEELSSDSYSISLNQLIISESVEGVLLEVKYIAGGRMVESDIKAAILLTAAKYFNDPVDSVETLPSVATNLLGQYRRWGVEDAE